MATDGAEVGGGGGGGDCKCPNKGMANKTLQGGLSLQTRAQPDP
jgi:hypothetical protein